MLMIQGLNALLYIVGVGMARLLLWGLWVKERPAGAPVTPYFRQNLGEIMTSFAITSVAMGLWLSGNLSGLASQFSDLLPASLTFGEQIQVSAVSSLVAGAVIELAAPTILLWLLSKLKAFGSKGAPVLLLALLACSTAYALPEEPCPKATTNGPCVSSYWDEMTQQRTPGTWYLPVSLLYLRGYTSQSALDKAACAGEILRFRLANTISVSAGGRDQTRRIDSLASALDGIPVTTGRAAVDAPACRR